MHALHAGTVAALLYKPKHILLFKITYSRYISMPKTSTISNSITHRSKANFLGRIHAHAHTLNRTGNTRDHGSMGRVNKDSRSIVDSTTWLHLHSQRHRLCRRHRCQCLSLIRERPRRSVEMQRSHQSVSLAWFQPWTAALRLPYHHLSCSE